jgi:hypothetical protein
MSIPAPQIFHINKQAYVMRKMDNGAIRLRSYAKTHTHTHPHLACTKITFHRQVTVYFRMMWRNSWHWGLLRARGVGKLTSFLLIYLLNYILIYIRTYILTYLHIYLYTYIIIYLLTYVLTYSHTHSLTPCSRVLLEKLTGFQLVKKFPAFYGTWKFITTFTSAH